MLNINFPISTLISGFENPESGYRTAYRKILRERFFFVEWKQQLEILESFAQSTARTDVSTQLLVTDFSISDLRVR